MSRALILALAVLAWRPKYPSPTWRSFLHNHLTDIAAIDMFVVATATFRILYALIVLGHDRRKVIHFDVTHNPTLVWLSRQMTEVSCCRFHGHRVKVDEGTGGWRWDGDGLIELSSSRL